MTDREREVEDFDKLWNDYEKEVKEKWKDKLWDEIIDDIKRRHREQYP